jgi:hypothetical protein
VTMEAFCPHCGSDDIRFNTRCYERPQERTIQLRCAGCKQETDRLIPRQGCTWQDMFPEWHRYVPDYSI